MSRPRQREAPTEDVRCALLARSLRCRRRQVAPFVIPDVLLAKLARRNAKIATLGSTVMDQQQRLEPNARNVQQAGTIRSLAAAMSHIATSARAAAGPCADPTFVRHALLGVTARAPARSSVPTAALNAVTGAPLP